MSDTKKDRANHFLHHLLPDANRHGAYTEAYTWPKQKYDAIPADVKDLADAMDRTGAGCRYGINRKMYVKQKVDRRRTERAKAKEAFRERVWDDVV